MITPQTRRQASQIFNDTHSDSDDIGDGVDDMRSPLDRTIDKIGMGPYQWALLGLCGFDVAPSDSYYSPRVQDEYAIPDSQIGLLSASMFCGMMFGALGWGSCSDVVGRSMAFNLTLAFTSLFGVLACLSTSFVSLCFFIFLLGSAVGGSMPTDGTLFLENVPKKKQYLLTALSVFFSLVHCPEPNVVAPENSTSNSFAKLVRTLVARGTTLGTRTHTALRRRNPEQGLEILVSAGRNTEAVAALQSIEDYNMKFGRPSRSRFVITLADVCDAKPSAMLSEEGVMFDAGAQIVGLDSGKEDDRSQALSQQPADRTDYRATSQSPEGAVGQGWSFDTPMPPHADENASYFEQKAPTTPDGESGASTPGRSRSSVYVEQSLPSTFGRPIATWLDRVAMLFTPEWRLTTILIWCAWWGMSLAFTMFNVYLPKLLERRLGDAGGGEGSRKEALWDIVIFTLGGCPGALIGAWMIESPLGRRKSLALSTFMTAMCCLAFVQVESKTGVVWSTIGVSLASAIMWAVLYGMTPEIFDTKVRGTACGTASALNRVGYDSTCCRWYSVGCIARISVYASIAVFLFSVVCVLLLPFEKCPTDGKDSGSDDRGEYTALH
ncbi:Sugar transporter [Rhizoctonia solani]|uniref:Sugar transporter n=1 Tax=Rhizoctonia solani TaxID=456999 RepID=A0A8H7IGI3_9AGAM|nr:Sugar transporter [Rhizoctonia solani]